MSTRENYADGLSLGTLYADAEQATHSALGVYEAELREEARLAREDSPSWRAFKLGIVRGYRQSVRTLRAGRWGT